MSAMQKVAPHIDHFQEKIRDAKESQHLTIDQLAEKSGVPNSVVGRISSGSHPDPKLINAAALCEALGLSLDELCGLRQPQISDSALREANHALELENEHLRGENGKLAAVDAARMESLATQKPILRGLFLLFVLSIVTTLALLAYIIGDAMHESVGLIQYGELSKPAIAAIIVIVAALINACILAYRIYKHKE